LYEAVETIMKFSRLLPLQGESDLRKGRNAYEYFLDIVLERDSQSGRNISFLNFWDKNAENSVFHLQKAPMQFG
jgi:hypothetical protein